MLSKLQNNVVSLAYISILKISLAEGRSLIYIKNRSGPKIDPWGTPIVTGRDSELKPR